MARRIFDFLDGTRPYVSAAIIFSTAALDGSIAVGQIPTWQPTFPGYAPIIRDKIEQLFPDRQLAAGEFAWMKSIPYSSKNLGTNPVILTAAVFVIFDAPPLYTVAAIAPISRSWQPGEVITGRLTFSVSLYTEAH